MTMPTHRDSLKQKPGVESFTFCFWPDSGYGWIPPRGQAHTSCVILGKLLTLSLLLWKIDLIAILIRL